MDAFRAVDDVIVFACSPGLCFTLPNGTLSQHWTADRVSEFMGHDRLAWVMLMRAGLSHGLPQIAVLVADQVYRGNNRVCYVGESLLPGEWVEMCGEAVFRPDPDNAWIGRMHSLRELLRHYPGIPAV